MSADSRFSNIVQEYKTGWGFRRSQSRSCVCLLARGSHWIPTFHLSYTIGASGVVGGGMLTRVLGAGPELDAY